MKRIFGNGIGLWSGLCLWGGIVLFSTGCRRTAPSVAQYRFEGSGVEAWYPLDERHPDPDSLSGLRATLQADYVAWSPFGKEVAERINAQLLDMLCRMIMEDNEAGFPADGSVTADTVAAAIRAQYPQGTSRFDRWNEALLARYVSEYRKDMGGFADDIAAGRFSPNAAAYELECNQLLEVLGETALVWKTFLYVYTGGAHGMQTVQYLNIDPKTGELITLLDLFKPEMTDTVLVRVREKLAESAYAADIFDLTAVDLPTQFRLGGDSIVFQYQVYEIAPYVSGPIAVSLTRAELADCLR